MYISRFQEGHLVRHKQNGWTGTVKCKPFTKRFMEAQDYEMEAHGMGHMAGVYGTAVQIIWSSPSEVAGITRTYKYSDALRLIEDVDFENSQKATLPKAVGE